VRHGQLSDGRPIVARLCYLDGDVQLGIYSPTADARADLGTSDP